MKGASDFHVYYSFCVADTCRYPEIRTAQLKSARAATGVRRAIHLMNYKSRV
jgi:hypothetical protein